VGEDLIKERDMKKAHIDDVIGLLMKIRDEGGVTDTVIAKTIMQFFMDGFDTVAGYISMMIYFLAMNPEVQDKAMAEVDDFFDTYGTDVNGDNVNELKYLDQIFNETGRFLGIGISRTCTKPWTIPESNITIPKGMRVVVPINAMQLDPQYFPDPMEFKPERFSPENKANINGGVYMPFGTGPRQCIGLKIARQEAKILMYELLRHFRIEPCSKTLKKIVWSKDVLLGLEGGCHVSMKERN
jgi:cytochrome P450